MDSLEPIDAGWITTPIHPLPVQGFPQHGRPDILSAVGLDRILARLVETWIDGTVGGGENGLISRDDSILQLILKIAEIPRTSYCRNTTADGTVTVNPQDKPDFVALHNGVGILLVEEKDGNDLQGAIADINNKFGWISNLLQLPFFIAIAICKERIAVVVLRRGQHHQIVHHSNIIEAYDRVAFIPIAVNIGRVLKHFIQQEFIAPLPFRMNMWERRISKSIKITFRKVEVECDNLIRFQQLNRLYDACDDVQFVERKIDSDLASLRIFLNPVGISIQPRTFREFMSAVRCILLALKGMHRHGWFHTDVRWANIIFVATNGEWNWYLIDCYEACYSRQRQLRMQRAQERNVGGGVMWGPEHDIHQVVNLFNIVNQLPAPIADLNEQRMNFIQQIRIALTALNSLQGRNIDTLLRTNELDNL